MKIVPFIDAIYKNIRFGDLLLAISPSYQRWYASRLRKKQAQMIESKSSKSRYKVLFFLQNSSIWKYDTIYRLMEKSKLFDPVVAISPYNVHFFYDNQECLRVMQKAEHFAKEQGYNYISVYDSTRNKWIDIKEDVKPDIVFFSKPYKDTHPLYHLYHYKDCLTLHAPYGICCVDIYRINYNLPFNNLLWKLLVETSFQKGFAEQYSLCKGDNAEIIGALGTENFINGKYVPTDVWKPQAKKKKRIIWAPHHTVDYLFNFSNFLVYCEDMLQLAEDYKDKIQIAFKPHPVLKVKLINIWGKEKTVAYYNRWNELENTQLEEGNYTDLFLTSDALIHDCASFTAEYLYTQKPVLFMVRDENVLKHWNPFGEQCFNQHYHAHSMDEIRHFIDDVVIAGNDTMRGQREQFFRQYLYPADGIMPSEKIFNILKNALGV